MDIVIDGSYDSKTPDLIGCGVVVMDDFGFYTEHRFHIKHIAASSSFAEWYGLECALNMLLSKIEIGKGENVHIYTDCQSIIEVMNDRKGVTSKNELLHQYISRVIVLYTTIKSRKGIRCTFHHIKDCKDKCQIKKLHNRAHIKAQNPASYKKTKKESVENDVSKGETDKVLLQIKLEPVSKGHRKWVMYENHKKQYTGKLKTILNRYQRERYNIKTLSKESRLETDKGTNAILKKYIGSV